MDLFAQEKQHFTLPNAELIYIPNFFSKQEADSYFKTIETKTNWQQMTLLFLEKLINNQD